MREDTARLFDEFAALYAAGEDPDLRAFIDRAGDDGEALALLVDGYLAGSETPDPSDERVELMRAWVRGEPPILELRRSRRLKRSEVVARLTKLLGLGPEREQRVAFHYHRLESGLVDPRAPDRRVWEALRETFGTDVRALATWRPARIEAKPAFRTSEISAASSKLDEPATPGPDADAEVDRLFLSGS